MSRRSAQRGLTLIELMVALSVFAVLGVLPLIALAQVVQPGIHLGTDTGNEHREAASLAQLGGER